MPIEPGTRIASYEVIESLGAGGMGEVFEAHDERLGRRVALKLVRIAAQHGQVLKRFEYEAQILGHLKHSGIAQVYETGTAETPEGLQPWFAMELVDGVELIEFAKSRDLTTGERVALMRRVCEAVQHAHQKGVIHRDLKPANILVTKDGQPKVLDFGVARVSHSDMMTVSLQTNPGQLLGTVPYMSPEQVSGDNAEVDTRSDVYALGLVLYELLTDRLPYDLDNAAIYEAARVIREVEPTPLSSVDRTYRGDLDTIIAKALEKDRDRRYESAAELGDDLQRFLDDVPIFARPPSALYQMRKFARRHKAVVAGILAVFVSLAGGLVLSISEARRANAAEAQIGDLYQEAIAAKEQAQANAAAAKREAERAYAAQSFLRQVLVEARPDTPDDRDLTMVDVLEYSVAQLDQSAGSGSPLVEATIRQSVGIYFDALNRAPEATREYRRALELIEASVGRETPDWCSVAATLSRQLGTLGQPEEGLDLAERALATLRRIQDGESTEQADVLLELGRHSYNLQRFEQEKEFNDEALAMHGRVSGEDSRNYGVALHSVAFTLAQRRQHVEAIVLYRRSLEISERVHGPQHRFVASVQKNLSASLVLRKETLPEAEELAAKSLATRRLLFPVDHPAVLTSQSYLAQVYTSQGKLSEAEPLLREVLEGRRRVLGDHRDTATSLTNLSRAVELQGRLDEAEALLRESLVMRDMLFGVDNAASGDSMNRLAQVLGKQGRGDAAIAACAKALSIWEKSLGSEHSQVGWAHGDYAKYLRDIGEVEDALAHYRQASEIYTRVHGEANFWIPFWEMEIGWLLLGRGDWSTAADHAREMLARWPDHPDEHPIPAAFKLQLAAAEALPMAELEPAEQLLLPAVEALLALPKVSGPIVRGGVALAAALYERHGDPARAADWRAKAER